MDKVNDSFVCGSDQSRALTPNRASVTLEHRGEECSIRMHLCNKQFTVQAPRLVETERIDRDEKAVRFKIYLHNRVRPPGGQQTKRHRWQICMKHGNQLVPEGRQGTARLNKV